MSEPEFDDVEEKWGYVSSKKARTEIGRLMREHGLGYYHNPGGGEFSFPGGGRCQTTGGADDLEDLRRLRDAIERRKEDEGRP